MLGFMRGFVKSKWSVGLFALLIISFGIFGFQDPFRGVVGGGFVQVGDREIRPLDVNRQVDVILERYRLEKGEVLSPSDAAQNGVTQEVLQNEVRRVATSEFGKKIGVVASQSAVTNLISATPGFKDALGRLSIEQVAREAESRKMSVPEFEAFLRDSLTGQYLEQAVEAALVTPEILTRPLLRFNGEMRTLSLARLSRESLPEPKTPPEAELRDFYAKNTARFQQPERRRISVISYSPADFLDKVELKDAEVKTEYDRRIRDFSSPETREVAQFTAADRNALQTFVDLVKSGTSLEEAIKKSAGVTRVDLVVKPGDLTDKDYDRFIFSSPVATLQGPLPLNNAFYAVQVNKVTPGVAKPFEEVAETVRSQLAEGEAQRLFNGSEEAFYDMAGGGASLEEISKDIGAPVIQFDAVNASGQTRKRVQPKLLADHPDAMKTLFALSAGQTTDVIESENDRAIFRVDEVIAPYTLPYEEVANDVRVIYLAQKMQEAADKIAADMVSAVKAGQPFDKAAAAQKMAALGSVQVIRAANSPIDPNVREAAFKLQQGDVTVARDSQGAPWVVKVDKIEPLNPETEATLKTQIDQQVSQSLLGDVREVFALGLQAAVPIKPNEKAVTAYFDSFKKEATQ